VATFCSPQPANQYETHLSTFENSPRPHTWLPRSHAHCGRPQSDRRAPRQRPQAPRSVIVASRACACYAPAARSMSPASSPSGCIRMVDAAVFREVMARRPARRTAHFGLFVLPVAASEAEHPAGARWMVGVVLPKRCAKRAVTRNAIRRRIYAQLNLCQQQHQLQTPLALQIVVRLQSAWAATEFPSARSESLLSSVHAELQELLQPLDWVNAPGKAARGARSNPLRPA
jgi:ribonuclease P protein component